MGLAKERCQYVALTWDVAERAFFSDAFVAAEDRLPRFLRADGHDASASSVGGNRFIDILGLDSSNGPATLPAIRCESE